MATQDAKETSKKAFICPNCGVYAHHYWSDLIYWDEKLEDHSLMEEWESAECNSCERFSLWYRGKRVYPISSKAEHPNRDMPDEIRDDFEEARTIAELSPRGAAALLRLSIQKLCKVLGEPGENLNDDIAALVSKGLDERIQKALDIVRVIDNNAVHPGELDVRDRKEEVEALFRLINEIVEQLISKPKRLKELYEALPIGARESIERRNERARQN